MSNATGIIKFHNLLTYLSISPLMDLIVSVDPTVTLQARNRERCTKLWNLIVFLILLILYFLQNLLYFTNNYDRVSYP